MEGCGVLLVVLGFLGGCGIATYFAFAYGGLLGGLLLLSLIAFVLGSAILQAN